MLNVSAPAVRRLMVSEVPPSPSLATRSPDIVIGAPAVLLISIEPNAVADPISMPSLGLSRSGNALVVTVMVPTVFESPASSAPLTLIKP